MREHRAVLTKSEQIMDDEYVLKKIAELMPDDTKMPMGIGYVGLKNAVQADLDKLLRALLDAGKINYFKTLNGVTIYLRDGKNDVLEYKRIKR